jgi:hypothetical protein
MRPVQNIIEIDNLQVHTQANPSGNPAHSKRGKGYQGDRHYATWVPYNGALTKKEARAVAQLRTEASRLNGYLHAIGAAETAEFECGIRVETDKHYLFTCVRLYTERREQRARWPDKIWDLSFFQGGRRRGEEERGWRPEIVAIRAIAAYARATARLVTEVVEEGTLA